MKKRLLSGFMALVMCLSLLPTAAFAAPTAKADSGSSKTGADAFDIPTRDMTENEENDAWLNSPFGSGKDEWFNLTEVSELALYTGRSSWRDIYIRDYDGRGEFEPFDGDKLGFKGSDNDDGDGVRFADTVAFDPYGHGQKDHIAVIQFWKGGNVMELFVLDKNGNRVSETNNLWMSPSSDDTEHLDDVSAYQVAGFASITAGDYDGDGRDSIMVYRPLMRNQSPEIQEYTFGNNGNKLDRDFTFTDQHNVFDMAGYTRAAQKESMHRADYTKENTPLIHMTSDDTDKDGVDELVVTTSVNNTEQDDVTSRSSKMYVFDKYFAYNTADDMNNGKTENGGWKWNETLRLDSADVVTSSSQLRDAKRLRAATSSVGNVSKQGKVDCPEIVTAGWADSSDSDSDSYMGYVGAMITQCSGQETVENACVNTRTGVREKKAAKIGVYSNASSNPPTTMMWPMSTDGGVQKASEFMRDGRYDNNVQALVPVVVFSAHGVEAEDSIQIGDTVYEIIDSQLTEVCRHDYFNDSDRGIDQSAITDAIVLDAVAANFDGNIFGKEQSTFLTLYKTSGKNKYRIAIWSYQVTGSGEDAEWRIVTPSGDNDDPLGDNDHFFQDNVPYAFASLCTPDMDDDDSTIVKLVDVTRTYTDPDVLAVLEAAPYFAEVDGGDIGNSATTFGKGSSEGSGSSSSHGMSANVLAGFDWEVDDSSAGLKWAAGFEATLETSFTWETSQEESIEYSIDYSNDTNESKVVVYRRPVTAYKYIDKRNGETRVIGILGDLAASMISVDEYNDAAVRSGILSPIEEGTLGTPGDPFSYRSSASGYENHQVAKENASYSDGTITQSINYESTMQDSFSYDHSASFTAYYQVVGVKAGGGAGYNASNSEYTINTNTISRSGAVTGKKEDGYNFDWRFAHWTMNLGSGDVPVLGYEVENVVAPPTPPENLRVEDITSKDAVLVWDHSGRSADSYNIYQCVEGAAEPVLIGEVPGDHNTFDLKGLEPGTSYKYVVRSYANPKPGSGVHGLSVPSEEAVMTTAPEGVEPVTLKIINPNNDSRILNVRPGQEAVFDVEVFKPKGYTSCSTVWQVRPNAQSPWKDMTEETREALVIPGKDNSEFDGYQYRCKANALRGNNYIPFYSEICTLKVGRADVDNKLSVNGKYESTMNDPITGMASGSVANTTEKQDIQVPVILDGGMPVYEQVTYSQNSEDHSQIVTPTGKFYAVELLGKDQAKYYQVTKANQDYSLGAEVEITREPVYTGADGTAVTLPEGADVSSELNTKDAAGAFYTLMAAPVNPVTADLKDSRLVKADGLTYYWVLNGTDAYEYGADGSVGAKAEGVNADSLYDVYFRHNSTEGVTDQVILGRSEVWEIPNPDPETAAKTPMVEKIGFWYEKLELVTETVTPETTAAEGGEAGTEGGDPAPEPETVSYYKATPFTAKTKVVSTVGGQPLNGFDPSALEVVNKTVAIDAPVYESVEGDAVQLKNVAVSNKTNIQIPVEFYITSLSNGGTKTIRTTSDSSGVAQVSWIPDQPGLYAIQSASMSTGDYYAGRKTEPIFYRAGERYSTVVDTDKKTEYQLLVKYNNKPVGSDFVYSYNKDMTFVLMSRTSELKNGQWVAGQWNKLDTGVSFDVVKDGVTTSATQGKFHVAETGGYIVNAMVDGEKAATSMVRCTPRSIVITPTWKEDSIPTKASDVSLKVTDTAGKDITGTVEDVTKLFNITSTYFENQEKTGLFQVILTDKPEAKDELAQFRRNYNATLASAGFVVARPGYVVEMVPGENGSMSATYGSSRLDLVNGERRYEGETIVINAEADRGYVVDQWTVNGEVITEENAAEKGFRLTGSQLKVESFGKGYAKEDLDGVNKMKVEVSFRSNQNEITFSAGENGALTATAERIGSEASQITSGTRVSLGSKVVFTAAPDDGFAVKQWIVNEQVWKNPDGSDYRGSQLVMDPVEQSYNVTVSFMDASEKIKVITEACDPDGTPNADAAVTVKDAYTGEEITDLANVAKGGSLTFTADLTSTINSMVKEWQVSYNGGASYETVKGSGAQNSISLYNLTRDVKVRVVITTAQRFELTWEIINRSGDLPENTSLKVTSKGVDLKAGDQSAYIPVDFLLTLNDNFELVGWAINGKTVEGRTAMDLQLQSLNAKTKITVTIKEKPVVTIGSMTGGTVEATGLFHGETVDLSSGSHVDTGSAITVTLKPAVGYEVGEMTAQAPAYVDESKSDDKTYTVDSVTEDVTLAQVWAEIPQYAVTGSIVDTNGEQPGGLNGSLTAAADRKGMESYTEAPYTDGQVYEQSSVTFTAKPISKDYRVKEWTLDGKIVTENTQGVTLGSNTLTLSDIHADAVVTVQFMELGGKISAAAGENGSIVKVVAANEDKTDVILGDGVTVPGGKQVVFTAQPAPGYEVAEWYVTGEAQNQNGNTFTYTTQEQTGAHITVTFRQVEYTLNFSGENGTVTAQTTAAISSGDKVRGGTEVTFTVVPDAGYTVTGWTVNGETVEGESGETFVWTVPASTEKKFDVKAICAKDTYVVTLAHEGQGSVSSKSDLTKVPGDTGVTFTAEPAEGWIVESWSLNGEDLGGLKENTQSIRITGTSTVSVKFVPAEYTVSFYVDGENGTLTAPDAVEGEAGHYTVTVPYGEDLTLTAVPAESFYTVAKWKVDGVEQDTKADELTLTGVKADTTVSVAFQPLFSYEVSYELKDNKPGSKVTVQTELNGQTADLGLAPEIKVNVTETSKVTFTAAPAADQMVKSWTVNGVEITRENMADYGMTHPLQQTLTIGSLTAAAHVVVTFEDLQLFTLPADQPGYTVTIDSRLPELPGSDSQIRKGGDVVFTVAPDANSAFKTLTVNGADCLKADALPEGMTVTDNKNGSYTVSLTDVQKNVELNAQTMEYSIVIKELNLDDEGMAALVEKFGSKENVEKELRKAASALDSKLKTVKLLDIQVLVSINGGDPVPVEEFPANGFAANISYIFLGTEYDKDMAYGAIRMNASGEAIGQTQEQSITADKDGVTVMVTGSAPFAIAWGKEEKKPPIPGGGGGGGMVVTEEYEITVNASYNGTVESDKETAAEDDTVTLTAKADQGKELASILVTTESGKEIVPELKDGKYIFTMPGENVTVRASFRCSGDEFCPTAHLKDNPTGTWYHDAVDFVVHNKIMNGVSSDRFAPDMSVSRSMVVTILYNLEGKPQTDAPMTFKDVAEGAWYYEPVRWAADNGIVAGYSAAEFGPDDAITREQMAVILRQYAQFKGLKLAEGADLSRYEDMSKVSAWASEAMAWANAEYLIRGVSDTEILPQGETVRAQAAIIIQHFCENHNLLEK